MVFLLVFVGGLLVLLVSLTSVLSLERFSGKVSLSFAGFMLFILVFIPLHEETSFTLRAFSWFCSQQFPILLLFLIFLIRLTFIT